MRATLVPVVLVFAACGANSPQGQSSNVSKTEDAADAKADSSAQTKRRDAIIADLERIRAADPEHGLSRYTLARVYAGPNRDRALQLLAELQAIADWDYRLAEDDFPTLAGDAQFRAIAKELAQRAPSPKPSAVAFELDAVDITPEGVAWDPTRSELLLGSMHQRAVFAADRKGTTRPVITEAQGGLLGVLGIEVDGQRDHLWAAGVALPIMRGFTDDQAGTSALFGFDLATGAPLGRWEVPEKPSQLNDLVVMSDGRVYVTDSRTGALLWRPNDAKPGTTLRTAVPAGGFVAANGIVDAADNQAVYVCDFHGIHRVELASGHKTLLAPPSGVTTLGGIDGIERHGDWLLAIQNIVGPGRVWALRLAADGRSIEEARVLDAAHPRYQSPTTGAIAGDRFLYLADAALHVDGDRLAPTLGERHAILSLPLP